MTNYESLLNKLISYQGEYFNGEDIRELIIAINRMELSDIEKILNEGDNK